MRPKPLIAIRIATSDSPWGTADLFGLEKRMQNICSGASNEDCRQRQLRVARGDYTFDRLNQQRAIGVWQIR
jgi:hypothetical protein